VPHRIYNIEVGTLAVDINLYSEEGTRRGHSPPRRLLAVTNVTSHPSTASVPITVLLYNGQLLRGFNVAVKGLKQIIFARPDAMFTVEFRNIRLLTYTMSCIVCLSFFIITERTS